MMSQIRRVACQKLAAVALSGILAPATTDAQTCQQIRFAPGAFSGEVAGIAPADGCACYFMDVGPRQNARVQVFSDGDAAVSVIGVADNRTDVAWVTTAGRYEICVHRTFRATGGLPFRMFVEVR
jgi:hypothetical protein